MSSRSLFNEKTSNNLLQILRSKIVYFCQKQFEVTEFFDVYVTYVRAISWLGVSGEISKTFMNYLHRDFENSFYKTNETQTLRKKCNRKLTDSHRRSKLTDKTIPQKDDTRSPVR